MAVRKTQGPSLFEASPDQEVEQQQTQETAEEHGMGWAARTVNGYDLDVAASALQKCIRRGRENEAHFWAHEIFTSGFVAYFWRRMVIIAHEECGSQPDVAVFVGMAAQNSALASKEFKGRLEGVIEHHAVIVACRAEKTREACDIMVLCSDAKKNQGFRIQPHDSAVDKHTRSGRLKKRSNIFFRTVGRLVAGVRGPNRYEKLAHGFEQDFLPRPEEAGGEPDIQWPPRTLRTDEEERIHQANKKREGK